VTPYVNETIASSSMRLRDSGRRVNWVVLGKNKPEELFNITMYHLPIQEEEPDIEVPDDMILRVNGDGPTEIKETPRQRYLRMKAEMEESDD
jgi:hypothetical protein